VVTLFWVETTQQSLQRLSGCGAFAGAARKTARVLLCYENAESKIASSSNAAARALFFFIIKAFGLWSIYDIIKELFLLDENENEDL
jgi:hypothetical protein